MSMIVSMARSVSRREEGSTTAEYATCTTAAAGFAAVLYKILTSPTVHEVLGSIFSSVLRLPWG